MTNQLVSARETASRLTDTLPAPRSESGIIKLRGRAAVGAGDGGGALRLGDPFVELFANIAIAGSSKPAPAQSPERPPPENKFSDTPSETDDSPEKSESHTGVDVGRSGPVNPNTSFTAKTDDESSEIAELVPPTQTATARNDADDDDENGAAQIDAQHNRDEPTNVVPFVAAQANDQVDEAAIDAEVVVAGSLDRNRSESHRTETDAEETTIEPGAIRAKADRKELAGDAVESQEQAAPDKQETPANGSVQRRRYTDRSEQQAAPNQTTTPETRSASDAGVVAHPHSNDSEVTSRENKSIGNNGIDISGMTATQSFPPLSAVAVSTASRSAGVSVAAGIGGKSVSSGSVTSSNSAAQSSDAPSSFGLDPSGRSPHDAKSTTTKSSTGVDTSAAVQRAKLAQRVSRGFQHLGSGGGQIRMRLSPDHLGSVQLQMTIQNGKLNGRMVTQSDAAAQLLREQLPSLRAMLENQGIRMERIDIETDSSLENASRQSDGRQPADTTGGFAGQQFPSHQGDADDQHRSRTSRTSVARRNRATSANQEMVSSAPIRALPILPGRVDLRV